MCRIQGVQANHQSLIPHLAILAQFASDRLLQLTLYNYDRSAATCLKLLDKICDIECKNV